MQKILILDFGSQYTHLIATRIRKLGVYTEIMPNDVDITTMTDVQGIILSGGPYSVYESDSPQAHPSVWTANIPILGICYGHQLIAHMLGGTVKPGQTKEYGIATLTSSQHPLFAGLAKQETIWMSHGDEVTVLPKGFSCLGSTHDCINAVMGNDEKKIY